MRFRMILPAALLPLLVLCTCGRKTAQSPPAPQTPQQEADEALANVKQLISLTDFDTADKLLAKLDELKPNLPAEYAAKIAAAKQAVADAEAKRHI